MPKERRLNKTAVIFIVFLAVSVLFLCGVIYSTPAEVFSGTAGNYAINLSNGGYVVEDNGFLFFSIPNEKGIYRIETEKNKNAVKIIDEGDGFLQNLKNAYYYSDNNKLRVCDWDGKQNDTILEYAENPSVIGSFVFYIDESGTLCKYSGQKKISSKVFEDNRKVKEFLVYYRKIYYVGEDGNIRESGFDGKDDKIFVKAQDTASKLSMYNNYIFYLDSNKVCSARKTDGKVVKAEITKADDYAVASGYILFQYDNKVYHAELDNLISKKDGKKNKISDKKIKAISIDENYFYFFDEDNNLLRIDQDGKNLVTKYKKGK